MLHLLLPALNVRYVILWQSLGSVVVALCTAHPNRNYNASTNTMLVYPFLRPATMKSLNQGASHILYQRISTYLHTITGSFFIWGAWGAGKRWATAQKIGAANDGPSMEVLLVKTTGLCCISHGRTETLSPQLSLNCVPGKKAAAPIFLVKPGLGLKPGLISNKVDALTTRPGLPMRLLNC